MRISTQRPTGQPPASGVAALTVVMVLFFIMALVAAYTNRNLIFEQRIAANSYRSARAADAAEAGLDWALAMLNGGRVDDNCVDSVNPANSDFRRRYLDESDPAGGFSPTWGFPPQVVSHAMYPACINRDGALNCVCPSLTQRTPTMTAPTDGIGSAFSILFKPPWGGIWPGSISLETLGCSSPGTGSSACYSQSIFAPEDVLVDAKSSSQVTLGLLRALPVAPVAALSVWHAVIGSGAGRLVVSNPDARSGKTVLAGAAIFTSADNRLVGPAGSSGDGTAASQSTGSADQWFQALFGVDRATFRTLPAVVRVDCAGGCTQASLTNTFAGHPRNPILVDGNLTINDASSLGTAAEPLMMVVFGTLTLAGNTQITGFVHADNVVWSPGADAALVRGAMASAGDFTTTTTVTLIYDRSVLDIIQLRYGSFVRVPGSWKTL